MSKEIVPLPEQLADAEQEFRSITDSAGLVFDLENTYQHEVPQGVKHHLAERAVALIESTYRHVPLQAEDLLHGIVAIDPTFAPKAHEVIDTLYMEREGESARAQSLPHEIIDRIANYAQHPEVFEVEAEKVGKDATYESFKSQPLTPQRLAVAAISHAAHRQKQEFATNSTDSADEDSAAMKGILAYYNFDSEGTTVIPINRKSARTKHRGKFSRRNKKRVAATSSSHKIAA